MATIDGRGEEKAAKVRFAVKSAVAIGGLFPLYTLLDHFYRPESP